MLYSFRVDLVGWSWCGPSILEWNWLKFIKLDPVSSKVRSVLFTYLAKILLYILFFLNLNYIFCTKLKYKIIESIQFFKRYFNLWIKWKNYIFYFTIKICKFFTFCYNHSDKYIYIIRNRSLNVEKLVNWKLENSTNLFNKESVMLL